MSGCSCEKCVARDKIEQMRVLKEWNEGKRDIVFENWETTCGDGCCYEHGTNLYINGYQLTSHASGEAETIRLIFEFLGEQVNIKEIFESDEL